MAAQGVYKLDDLGPNVTANGVNALRQVVGVFTLSNLTDSHAFLFDHTTSTFRDLGTLGGQNSEAFAINATGLVVGESNDNNGDTIAFVDDGASMTALGTLPGDVSSSARAINGNGAIVGLSQNAAGDRRAFFYDQGMLSDIGTLGGNTAAYGISDANTVVGYSFDGNGDRRAFIWDATNGMRDLLAGITVGDSVAWAISGNYVAGQFTTDIGDTHAFRFDPSNNAFLDLGTLGGISSAALGVNALGVVVGTSATSLGDAHAFVWSSGGMRDLNLENVANPTGLTFLEARGINSCGDIVSRTDAGGGTGASLLIAAPDPPTVCLLGSGILFSAIVVPFRLRKRKVQH